MFARNGAIHSAFSTLKRNDLKLVVANEMKQSVFDNVLVKIEKCSRVNTDSFINNLRLRLLARSSTSHSTRPSSHGNLQLFSSFAFLTRSFSKVSSVSACNNLAMGAIRLLSQCFDTFFKEFLNH